MWTAVPLNPDLLPPSAFLFSSWRRFCHPECTSDFNSWPLNARGQRCTGNNFTLKMKGKWSGRTPGWPGGEVQSEPRMEGRGVLTSMRLTSGQERATDGPLRATAGDVWKQLSMGKNSLTAEKRWNEKPVINYSPSCRSKPLRPSFLFRTQIRIVLIKSECFLTLHRQQGYHVQGPEGSKDIDKIVHVTSVVQLSFHDAMGILFVHKEN